MNFLDTTENFFIRWEKQHPFTLEHLKKYFSDFPNLFDTYFKSHCKRTPERLGAAIEQYSSNIVTMKNVASVLPMILYDVYERMSRKLQFPLSINVCILVGCYGSNAIVTHDGTLHFAIETLSDDPRFLKVLVTHEMAHAFHFAMLKEKRFLLSKFAWDGYTSLYIEGLATFLSIMFNHGFDDGVYYSYNDTGEEWYQFCKQNEKQITSEISEDLEHWSMEEEREWFRINGGKKLGFNRIRYYVGTEFVKFCIKKYGLDQTITLWAQRDIKLIINDWISSNQIIEYSWTLMCISRSLLSY